MTKNNIKIVEIFRYGINGLAATAVHYIVLTFNLKVIELPSAGLANLIAALFGITASFLGSRYFVFPGTGDNIFAQAAKFSVLYGAIAILHGLVLLVWTDWIGNDYRVGFLLATSLQVLGSYFGNKFLVFRV
jgi:putative flippase GtrA